MQFRYIKLNRGRCYSVLPEVLVMVLSRILFHGIVQNFACNILILKAKIDMIFAGTGSQIFSRNFEILHILISKE